MKTTFPLLICILIAMPLWANHESSSLYVLDPQNRWRSDRATIEEASLTIKPAGIYMEFGLYLTFSAKSSSFYGSANPPLEIVMNFCLPERAIIHDSWLWVNDDIMQALLVEKSIAYQIYEGIVNRRKDPSVLYKLSEGCYELRIYPLAGNSTRKAKITYLVPARWTGTVVSAPLPIEVLQVSQNVPGLTLNIHTDATFSSPSVHELGFLPFGSYAGGGIYTATIPPSMFDNYNTLEVAYASPLQNGIFSCEYPAGNGNGYYQLVFNPQQALGLHTPQKVAIVLEHNPGNSEIQRNELLVRMKEMLSEYFTEADSFNLFFSTNGVTRVSSQWMPVTQGMIASVISSIPSNWQGTGYLQSLLASAISFIRAAGNEGRIVLITNADYQANTYSTNQLANQIVAAAKPDIDINIVNYADRYFNYSYYGYSGDYLYQQLSGFTGGNYVKHQIRYDYYDYWYDYYYSYELVTTFTGLMHTMFSSFDKLDGNFSLLVEPEEGFSHSVIDLKENENAGLPLMYVGKYYGASPLKLEYIGLHHSSLVQQSWQLEPYVGDSLTRKLWAGNLIRELERGEQLNTTKREIIDTSIAHRVLSLYTAFLALEPNDTISACESCEDDSEVNNPAPTAVSSPASAGISFTASSNPFIKNVILTISCAADFSNITLKIYNMMGEHVKMFLWMQLRIKRSC